MKNELKVAVVGLGNRGASLLKHCILPREDVRVAAAAIRMRIAVSGPPPW